MLNFNGINECGAKVVVTADGANRGGAEIFNHDVRVQASTREKISGEKWLERLCNLLPYLRCMNMFR